MSSSTALKILLTLSLGALLSCSASRYATPASTDELESLVLIIQETADGQVTHTWQRAEEFDLSPYRRRASNYSVAGRIVLAASRERDCHAEYLQCLEDCESSSLPPGYEHIDRGGPGHSRFCREKCRQPYLDCEELQELRARRPHEFTAIDSAVDWLKRNRKAVLVGTVVVIAGVVFVTVSAGAGAVVLVPVVLLASSDLPSGLHLVGVIS